MKPESVASTPAAIHLALLINMLSMGCMMMVMPLGPELVTRLGMLPEQTGYFSGGATLGAALLGLLAAPWLDRVNRKPALLVLLVLRFLLLMACALAEDSQTLLLLFILSGCVAGPLGAILMAAVLDLVPPAERGRRLAYVGMAFSLAAILIVPAALVLAQWSGWQSPFLLFGAGGLLLALLCAIWLPSLPVNRAPAGQGMRQLLGSPLCQGALFILCLQMFGHFLLIPHFANYFQFNLGFPREQIASLYLCGGLASMATMRLCGGWIDQGRAQGAILLTSLALALITLVGFALPAGLPLYLLFTLFMALSSARASTTLAVTAAIPAPHQRAAFMSFQGSVTNVAAGLGSLFSARYLVSDEGGALQGFSTLAWINIACTLVACAGVWFLIRSLKRTRDNNNPASGTARQGSQ
ncbi:MFS transporter [Aeromonas caviae]|uniref:MFS transporter n=1 Tax=Aeromonas caviae TaxID=648 RepID=A0A7H9F2X7_AERCA|nr:MULTISPECIES: MFS transporter [Aeromonas]MBL0495758.1 MFS transporter [Aeromonas caviae]MBL0581620.1 MFS transporter [Aeromonas caviae]MBP4034516.1 MFS transporter [Aeromonas sp. PrichA-15]MBP4067794.1 MFS transporter [Aeromonas sp. MaB10011B]MBP4080003.1 MFS transporter [Aeromonas sp. MrichA-1]